MPELRKPCRIYIDIDADLLLEGVCCKTCRTDFPISYGIQRQVELLAPDRLVLVKRLRTAHRPDQMGCDCCVPPVAHNRHSRNCYHFVLPGSSIPASCYSNDHCARDHGY